MSPVNLTSFTPNTKAKSADVNTNFINCKTAIELLETEKTLYTDTYNANLTFDLTSYYMHTVTLTGNSIFAVSNVTVGRPFLVRIVQGGSGSYTVTWWVGIVWPDNIVPTLTTTVGKIDVFGFLCTATNVYDGYIVGANL